jgi:hypothetical protein
MYDTRILVVLAAQFATVAALFPAVAGAEAKNQAPFTRPAERGIVTPAVREGRTPGVTPQTTQGLDPAIATAIAAQAARQSSGNVAVGEAKNDLPFTQTSGETAGVVSTDDSTVNWLDVALAAGALGLVGVGVGTAAKRTNNRRNPDGVVA